MKFFFAGFLLFITVQTGFAQGTVCENSNIHFDKFFGTSSSAKDIESPLDIPVRKAGFNYGTDNKGNEMAVIHIWGEGGTDEQPHYYLSLIFSKSQLNKKGIIKIPLIDSWSGSGFGSSGLEAKGSGIVKFKHIYDYGAAQWTNWGGHKKGNSEGEIIIEVKDENTICGSVTFKTYADGSSLNPDYYSQGSVKSFIAKKIEE